MFAARDAHAEALFVDPLPTKPSAVASTHPVVAKEVNAPVPGVVLPMAGGAANRPVNPAPLTVLLAARVVNDPVLPLTGAFVIVPPEIVGVLIAGEPDNTTAPDPVDEVVPVPPFAVVNGFCNVKLLKVGEG